MIGQRTKHQLRAAEAQNVGGDHILPVVLVFDAKAGADLLKAGQHDVDRQGIEGDQPCRQGDELPARNRQDEAGLGRRSFLIHQAVRSENENAPESRRITPAKCRVRADLPEPAAVRQRGR